MSTAKAIAQAPRTGVRLNHKTNKQKASGADAWKTKCAAKTKKTLKNMGRHWQLYLLLIPIIVFFIVFKYVPMYGLQIAFRDYMVTKGFSGSPWVGLKHFNRFVHSPEFWLIIKNTLTISVFQLLISFPLPIIISLLINQLRKQRSKTIIQNVLIAPHFISLVVLIGMVMIFLNPRNGLINQLIIAFGGEPIHFLGKPEYFKGIYILSGVWQNTGWDTVIYIAALSSIDPALYEAATVDGATRWQKIWRIDFPGILPVVITQLILNCGQMLSIGYEKILLLQNPLNRVASEVISTYEYQQGILNSQFSYSTAIGLFNAVINFAILLLVNHLAKKYSDTSIL